MHLVRKTPMERGQIDSLTRIADLLYSMPDTDGFTR